MEQNLTIIPIFELFLILSKESHYSLRDNSFEIRYTIMYSKESCLNKRNPFNRM